MLSHNGCDTTCMQTVHITWNYIVNIMNIVDIVNQSDLWPECGNLPVMSAAILCILAYWKISQHIGFNNNSMKSNISFRMFCQIFSACWYESSTNGLGGLILRIPAGPKFLSTTRKNLTILIFLSSLFVAHYCYTETLVIFYKITTWVVSRCIKNVHST